MTSAAPDAKQLSRTGRAIAAGIWVCAAITMAASVVNGTSVFAKLDPGWTGTTIGLLTALAVDACLVMVLCGDRQMQALGLTAGWGRVLRVGTLGMSLALNCGAAIHEGHYFLAALHAIPPLLIVGMSEYGQEVMLTFTRELRRREAERLALVTREQNARQAQVDADNVKQKLVAEEEGARRRLEDHQRTLTAEAEKTAAASKRAADEAERLRNAIAERAEVAREALRSGPHLVVDNTRSKAKAATSAVSEQAQAWLMEQHRAGIPLDSDDARVGPSAIAAATGLNSETSRKRHRQWKAAVIEELALRAELEEAAG